MLTTGRLQTGHPEEEVLEQYVMGKLEEPVAEALEDHVFSCSSCQERVEFAETYVRSMKSALASALKTAPESSWRTRIVGLFSMGTPAWAAAAAVLLLGIGVVLGTRYYAPSAMPVAVALTATRGETASIVAKGPLDLDLDARDLNFASSYRVQIVNGEGSDIWDEASAAIQNGHLHVRVNKHLSRGQYFVRVFGSGSSTPREYALQLR